MANFIFETKTDFIDLREISYISKKGHVALKTYQCYVTIAPEDVLFMVGLWKEAIGDSTDENNEPHGYSIFAQSEEGTEDVWSASSEKEAELIVKRFTDQLKDGTFQIKTSLREITGFSYDTLGSGI